MLVIAYMATLGEVVFEIAFKKVREYRQSFIWHSGAINGKDGHPVQAYGAGHSGGEVYTDCIPPPPKGDGDPQEGPRPRDDDADDAEVDAACTRRSSRSQSAFKLSMNGNNVGGSRSDQGHGQSFQHRRSGRTSDGDIESIGAGM